MDSLTKARGRLNLTQPQMAKRLNVSLDTIKKWELENNIKSIDVIKIAKCYEMTNYELLQYLMKKIKN